MIKIRRGEERGKTRIDWLDSRHSFSFGDYYDPAHMGYRGLRVINEDWIAAGAGFPTHPHRDMEIVTLVLSGTLEHRDSLGSGEVIRPGDVQRMSAGTGIRHSEFNPSKTEPTHLLQIWILPERAGLQPSYEQKHFDEVDRRGRLRLVADRQGMDGAVTIQADARIHAGLLPAGERIEHKLTPGRHSWLQIARGEVELDGQILAAGDAAAIEGERVLRLAGRKDADLALFDLA
ncbi:MAG: pirin family protein [Alphaproteobacteria bacterium]